MGSTKIEAPSAPTPQETTKQAIDAQVQSLPDILKAQQEFGPQFAQTSFDQEIQNLKQFAPGIAEAALKLQEEFGPRYAEALKAEQEAASPELAASRKVLTDYLGQEELLTPEEERQATQDIRGAQNVRGFGLDSGVGAQDELSKLTDLRQRLKERRLNIALSTSGRAPITGATQFQPAQTSPGQLVQNVNPGQIFGLATSNYATGSANAQAQAKNTNQLFGAGLGALGTVGGSIFGAGGMFGGK